MSAAPPPPTPPDEPATGPSPTPAPAAPSSPSWFETLLGSPVLAAMIVAAAIFVAPLTERISASDPTTPAPVEEVTAVPEAELDQIAAALRAHGRPNATSGDALQTIMDIAGDVGEEATSRADFIDRVVDGFAEALGAAPVDLVLEAIKAVAGRLWDMDNSSPQHPGVIQQRTEIRDATHWNEVHHWRSSQIAMTVFFPRPDSSTGPDVDVQVEAIARLWSGQLAGRDCRARVTGGADTQGGDAHNYALAAERARAVADLLSRQGLLPRSRIETFTSGERGLSVQTGDRADALVNRRADIVITCAA